LHQLIGNLGIRILDILEEFLGKKGKLNEVSESWNEDWTDWTAEGWDDDDYRWSG
jgi:hypothetical protein